MKLNAARVILLQSLFVGLASAVVPIAISAEPPAPPHADHVVILVLDGLRPDSVTLQDMPTLYALSQEGTTFANHHPVYLSSTEVNGTALATGAYPRHSGIMGNKEFRPPIDPAEPVAMETIEAIRKGDTISGGRYVAQPTLPELLQKAGRRTVVVGTKPVALLWDRSERPEGAAAAVLYKGKSIPAELARSIKRSQGKLPEIADSTQAANVDEDAWTTQALIEQLWTGYLPALTVVWLSEPDYAQHGSGPNSSVAKSALKSCDDNLARLLKALDEREIRGKTDVLVVSDHGFSTVGRNVDVVTALNDVGFRAFRKFSSTPVTGDVLALSNGGTIFFYVQDHDKRTIQRVADFLQTSDFAGVIFSRFPSEGTFPLEAALVDTPAAPDLVCSLRWSDQPSRTGMPGLLVADSKKRGPGQGEHASLSRYDMHNTLIAAGPDFRPHFVDNLPSGNIDVAPTVLAILGVEIPSSDTSAAAGASPQGMDGRVLSEALVGRSAPSEGTITETLEAAHALKGVQWHQYLRISKLGRQIYLDEGNGQASLAP